MKTYLTLLVMLCYSTQAFALFCPGANNKSISFGDTIERVEQQCGPPSVKTVSKLDNQPQEWTYYTRAQFANQGTYKVTVSLRDRKVVNIIINDVGINIASTQLCGSGIQLGYTAEQVEAVCGKPVSIFKPNPDLVRAEKANPSETVTEITYLGSPGSPAVTFIFVGGILKERR